MRTDPDKTDDEHSLASKQVREPSAEQQEATERERIPGHHPLPVIGREPQVALGGRQRDIHDRGVQNDHQLGEAQDDERDPPIRATGSAARRRPGGFRR
jgi:hypothetical protein